MTRFLGKMRALEAHGAAPPKCSSRGMKRAGGGGVSCPLSRHARPPVAGCPPPAASGGRLSLSAPVGPGTRRLLLFLPALAVQEEEDGKWQPLGARRGLPAPGPAAGRGGAARPERGGQQHEAASSPLSRPGLAGAPTPPAPRGAGVASPPLPRPGVLAALCPSALSRRLAAGAWQPGAAARRRHFLAASTSCGGEAAVSGGGRSAPAPAPGLAWGARGGGGRRAPVAGRPGRAALAAPICVCGGGDGEERCLGWRKWALRREIRHPAAAGGCGLAGLFSAPYPGSEVAEASGCPRGNGCEAGGGSGPGPRSAPAAGVRRAAAPRLAAGSCRRS